jgi:CheY-like chemotaxis protein
MGGKEAAAIIRQQDKHVPIIFLTGEIAASMKESTKEFAPAELLLKPCSKISLIAVSHLRLTELFRFSQCLVVFILVNLLLVLCTACAALLPLLVCEQACAQLVQASSRPIA